MHIFRPGLENLSTDALTYSASWKMMTRFWRRQDFKMEDIWVEENSALLTSASSQDCYIKEEEEKKSLMLSFRVFTAFCYSSFAYSL